jgi:hypothetical protein
VIERWSARFGLRRPGGNDACQAAAFPHSFISTQLQAAPKLVGERREEITTTGTSP